MQPCVKYFLTPGYGHGESNPRSLNNLNELGAEFRFGRFSRERELSNSTSFFYEVYSLLFSMW